MQKSRIREMKAGTSKCKLKGTQKIFIYAGINIDLFPYS
jgi:hypothetical protein